MFLTSWWSNNETLISIVIVYALVAFSIQVALKAGTFSLASIGFYSISSYTAADLTEHGWPTVLAIAAGVVLSGIVGWLLARLLVRSERPLPGDGDRRIRPDGRGRRAQLGIGHRRPGREILYPPHGLRHWDAYRPGRRGRSARAAAAWHYRAHVRSDARGHPAGPGDRNRHPALSALRVHPVGDARRALAGAMHALSSSAISPDDASFSFIILALAMVIIGGFGSWLGALIGAIVLGYLPLRLTSLGDWWPVIYGAMMLLVATYLPAGSMRSAAEPSLGRAGQRASGGSRRLAAGAGSQPRAAHR